MISQSQRTGSKTARTIFALAIFVGAIILFLLEPFVGKSLLPSYGGTPAVWNTCVVFFQLLLLIGYAYAHLLNYVFSIRSQIAIHAIIIIATLLTLPIRLNISGLSNPSQDPVFSLLFDLLTSVSLVLFIISATAPLLQVWYARSGLPGSPYLLYVASNAGSLIGLLLYPTLVEFWCPLSLQSHVLSGAFAGLVVLIAICGYVAVRESRFHGDVPVSVQQTFEVPITTTTRWNWFVWSLCPSSLMLGVTTYLSTEIAPMPAIWMLPLGLYLLSFVIAFANPAKWLVGASGVCYVLFAVTIVFSMIEHWDNHYFGFVIGLALHNGMLLCGGLAMHGRLWQTRPDSKHLTEFYLWISFGGLCGSIFNTLVAPVVFNWLAEYPLAIALGVLIVSLPTFKFPASSQFVIGFRFIAVAIVLAGISYDVYFSKNAAQFVNRQRSFFGEFHVLMGPKGQTRQLVHGGRVNHGMQVVSENPRERRPPLTYYFFTGPIGQVIFGYRNTPVMQSVGVVGLGIGSLAGYADPGEDFTFYEIDPAIVRLAEDPRYFTFLSDAKDRGAKLHIVTGDARLKLRESPDHEYGLLVLDAFTSDSIPVHLLTREAIVEYFSKLKPDGILAFHISNQFIDLEPVLANIADSIGCAAYIQYDHQLDKEEMRRGKYISIWAVMAANDQPLAPILSSGRWRRCKGRSKLGVWTDDQSSLLSVIRW